MANAKNTETPGTVLENVMHFGRLLRAAGMRVGTAQIIDAVRAIEAVDMTKKRQVYWALHSVIVNRADQRPLFDEAFRIFWRAPSKPQPLQEILADAQRFAPEKPNAAARRLAEAMLDQDTSSPQEPEQLEIDAELTYSSEEVLRAKDFEQMSGNELAEARRAIEKMHTAIERVATRRTQSDPRGAKIDMRKTLRAGLRGGDAMPLKRKTVVKRHPPLVVLCDISGSMSAYSRMVLHFVHALAHDGERVHAFVFGTRLTNITRHLKARDVDEALSRVSESVEDWGGGTRIGETIRTFNQNWSRRVLGQGATILLITDGLDRDAGEGLSPQMDRLQRSCRRLIWLNPLLRYDQFEPKSLGIRAMLPHVDEFKPVHNLKTLSELADALSKPTVRAREPMPRIEEAA
jgi:hypothetical protein